jgi:hypothetical protein
MNKLVVVAYLSILMTAGVMPTAVFAAPVPCEDMLREVKSALSAAKLTDTDKTKVADLENKGVERCKADDDARADAFFTQALALMGR